MLRSTIQPIGKDLNGFKRQKQNHQELETATVSTH
jgi:hypothetical protein